MADVALSGRVGTKPSLSIYSVSNGICGSWMVVMTAALSNGALPGAVEKLCCYNPKGAVTFSVRRYSDVAWRNEDLAFDGCGTFHLYHT